MNIELNLQQQHELNELVKAAKFDIEYHSKRQGYRVDPGLVKGKLLAFLFDQTAPVAQAHLGHCSLIDITLLKTDPENEECQRPQLWHQDVNLKKKAVVVNVFFYVGPGGYGQQIRTQVSTTFEHSQALETQLANPRSSFVKKLETQSNSRGHGAFTFNMVGFDAGYVHRGMGNQSREPSYLFCLAFVKTGVTPTVWKEIQAALSDPPDIRSKFQFLLK